MARSKEAARKAILDAADLVLKRDGAFNMTMDAVARAAGCAKGLLHYHFHTKQRLLVEAVGRISTEREVQWTQAFDTADPHEAIDRTWNVIAQEVESGTLRAWSSLLTLSDSAVDQAVSKASARFRDQITTATRDLLARANCESTLPVDRLGWLLTAVVDGMSFQLAAGADAEVLADAYAAAWLGVLSLTSPLR
ncbi:MAG: TetR/AcrR family transcriptional regulator [Gemmatimonadetes bacterium]|nr:TetR/AcrR family transcriptional regulator [Gemmatimonadota bacterium]